VHLFRTESPPGQCDLTRVLSAYAAKESPDTRNEAYVDLRHGEDGLAGRNYYICLKQEPESRTNGWTVDGCNDRHATVKHSRHRRGKRSGALVLRLVICYFQVLTCAEAFTARGENCGSGVSRAVDCRECGRYVATKLHIHRIDWRPI
jgi:hypothetical protein